MGISYTKLKNINMDKCINADDPFAFSLSSTLYN
jgi:hypothetical protein